MCLSGATKLIAQTPTGAEQPAAAQETPTAPPQAPTAPETTPVRGAATTVLPTVSVDAPHRHRRFHNRNQRHLLTRKTRARARWGSMPTVRRLRLRPTHR